MKFKVGNIVGKSSNPVFEYKGLKHIAYEVLEIIDDKLKLKILNGNGKIYIEPKTFYTKKRKSKWNSSQLNKLIDERNNQ